jgi:hypothetical protein
MKKLLLTFAAALLGLCSANAAETTDTLTIDYSAIYSANADIVGVANPFKDGQITITYAKGSGSYDPKYYASGTSVRVYANNTMTIAGGTGVDIKSIDFTYSGTYKWTGSCCNSGSFDTNYAKWTSAADATTSSLLLTNVGTSQVRIQKMVIIYNVTTNDNIQEATVSFGEGAQKSYAVNMTEAENFVAPTATTDGDGTITYVSSDMSVATVDADGKVTILGEGTTTITATAAATDNYKGASASYDIVVTDDRAVPTLAFSGDATYTIYLADAEDFVAPVATVDGDYPIVYSSNHPQTVAVNAETGAVTIYGTGTVIITATVAATSQNKGAEASYKLSVIEEAAVNTFDFASYSSITFNGGEEVVFDKEGAFEVSTMEKDGVTITNTNGTNTSTRIFSNKDGIQLRVYTGSQLTFTCPDKKQFKTITFAGSGAALNVDKGVYDKTAKTWTNGVSSASFVKAYEDGDDDAEAGEITDAVESFRTITFTATSTCKLTAISFDLESSTGVEEIEAEATGVAAYYNLQGVRVANPAHGIYIRVQGNRATKVML